MGTRPRLCRQVWVLGRDYVDKYGYQAKIMQHFAGRICIYATCFFGKVPIKYGL